MVKRTGLVTAGLIVAVIAAGAVAVGANLSILNAAEPASLGVLSASAAEMQPTAAGAQGGAPSGEPAAQPAQKYVIERAGVVSVLATVRGIRAADVSARHGWHWRLVQTSQNRLTVTFKSGKKTYVFSAVLRADGTVKARLRQPVTKVVTAPVTNGVVLQPAAGAGGGGASSAQSNGGSDEHEPADGDAGDHEGGEADD
jgi:hypothetical protein